MPACKALEALEAADVRGPVWGLTGRGLETLRPAAPLRGLETRHTKPAAGKAHGR